MNYQLGQYIVIETVGFLQRVFRYNNQWLNTDIDVVQVPSGSTLQVFEAFSEEVEKYPSVAVSSMGGSIQHLSMNNAQAFGTQEELLLSSRCTTTKTIDDTRSVAVQLPMADLKNSTIRGISAFYGWTGQGVGGDNINVVLYRDYLTSPVQVASASLPGYETVAFQKSYTEFSPYPLVSGTDYWMVFSSTADSPYNLGIDDTVQVPAYQYITVGGTTQASGSLAGGITFPASMTIGGAYNSKIGIRVRSKNSSKVTLQIAELIVQYCEYAKHAYISRASGATDGMKSIYLTSGVSEFTKKGIFIREVTIGEVAVQPRGQNDNIFSVFVILDCFSEWRQTFAGESLEDITTEITSFTI